MLIYDALEYLAFDALLGCDEARRDDNCALTFRRERIKQVLDEAKKYLNYPYKWGGSSPETSFDCSGFVSWVINHCGNGWNVGRLGAEGLRQICAIIPPSEAKPGDLIFFQGTYDTTGASHVAIYVGNNMMIHCGSPCGYQDIHSSYYNDKIAGFGRLYER